MAGNTLCIRCGKVRINGKVWTEKTAGSLITYTQTICPDRECQKMVEDDLAKKQDKMRAIQEKSLERRKAIKRGKKRTS